MNDLEFLAKQVLELHQRVEQLEEEVAVMKKSTLKRWFDKVKETNANQKQ